MKSVEDQLAAIGFARCRRDPPDWRVTRLDRPEAAAPVVLDKPCSRELMRWRRLLARDSRPSPYRISRIG